MSSNIAQSLSRVPLFAAPWTIAHQAPLSLEFSRQGYWNALPSPTPGDPPDPETEPTSSVSPALVRGFFITEPPGKSYLRPCCALLSHSVVSDSLRLEWVAFPFFGGSSQPRDQTQVSSTAGGFFTVQVIREANGLKMR